MKAQKIKIALVLFLIASSCRAQVLFTETLQASNLSETGGIAATPDGRYGITGDIYNTQTSAVFITKLNAAGSQAWSLSVSKNNPQYYIYNSGIIALVDSGFLVAAIQSNTDSAFIFRISYTGTVLWCKNISYASQLSMLQTTDEGFLIAGTRSFGSNIITVHKLDPNGVSQWDYSYQPLSGSPVKPGALLQNSNGDYTITSECFLGVQKQLRVMRVQSNGTLLWSRRYSTALPAPQVFSGYQLKERPGGSLAFLVSEHRIGSVKPRLAQIDLSSNGNINGPQFCFLLADTGFHTTSAAYTTGGGLAFGGYRLQNAPTASWVLKIDSTLTTEWANVYPATTSEYFNQLTQYYNKVTFCSSQYGSATITRVTNLSTTGQSACGNTPFVKTDSTMTIQTALDTIITNSYMSTYSTSYFVLSGTTNNLSCTTGINDDETTVTDDFSIATDPSGSFLFIHPGKSTTSDCTFQIYDVRGRLVLQAASLKTDREIKLNISQLSRGMYILTAKGKTIAAKKFLKE